MLKFDGVEMPVPADLQVQNNKIWSDNTGRSANGKLVGDMGCIKKKLIISWVHLTGEQVALINQYISNVSKPFFSVTFTDETFNEQTCTMYAGDTKYDVLKWVSPMKYLKNVTVDLIEC